jgi:signal peptidase
MNPEKGRSARSGVIGFLKEMAMAALAVALIMVCLYAYSGVWPPMVVVESGSMQHSETESALGIIDTGDMVFVKSTKGHKDIVTYLEGRETGLRTYGDYGQVIVYRPYGQRTAVPIIHRAVVWVEVNTSGVGDSDSAVVDYSKYTFDVPSLEYYNVTNFTIPKYGHGEVDLFITLVPIIRYHESGSTIPHDGFITAGDSNVVKYRGGYDQLQPYICADLIDPSWVIGTAFGEIPWFGLLKLTATGGASDDVPANSWHMLFISLFLILAVPLCVDLLSPRFVKWWRGRKRAENETRTSASPPEEKGKPGGETEGAAEAPSGDSPAAGGQPPDPP